MAKQQSSPFSLRIPPRLKEYFEEYAVAKEISLSQAILDCMRREMESNQKYPGDR
jgi:predicted HicB family RNase H-like nuclease